MERKTPGRIANETLERITASLLDLVLPMRCAGCRTTWLLSGAGHWCGMCLENLPLVGHPLCPICGRPFLKSPSSSDHHCGECLAGGFPFHTARSAVLHSGVVRERIHELKFGGRVQWVPALCDLLAMAFEKEGTGAVDLVLPVPLHVRRVRQRGFNQSGLLSKCLATRLGLSVRFDVIARKNWTEPQTRLDREQRLKNVRGAFRVEKPSVVRGLRVLLIDDVYTTGTTLGECARVLRRAGATAVHALTVSRAIPGWRGDDDGALNPDG
ncbi:MAG: ComF family protein [Syntrophobacteraceae bacterium]|nr:ComF family protein [Syntrophobacteraceae bacterium]